MKLVLCDRNSEMVDAWRREFAGPDFACCCGDILSMRADAIVAAGNSFGIMDGGLDEAYRDLFGRAVEDDLRSRIASLGFCGELLVGSVISVPTRHPSFPVMIYAPTMRVPSEIKEDSAVFLATRAAVRAGREFGTVLMPGLGTGCGKVSYRRAAHLMREGYQHGILDCAPPADWGQVEWLDSEFGPEKVYS